MSPEHASAEQASGSPVRSRRVGSPVESCSGTIEKEKPKLAGVGIDEAMMLDDP